jgi:hypothetical protein
VVEYGRGYCVRHLAVFSNANGRDAGLRARADTEPAAGPRATARAPTGVDTACVGSRPRRSSDPSCAGPRSCGVVRLAIVSLGACCVRQEAWTSAATYVDIAARKHTAPASQARPEWLELARDVDPAPPPRARGPAVRLSRGSSPTAAPAPSDPEVAGTRRGARQALPLRAGRQGTRECARSWRSKGPARRSLGSPAEWPL